MPPPPPLARLKPLAVTIASLLCCQVMPDDGTAETVLLNYLYARQMLRRLGSNLDITELQRKRSYWKQCSFNAVSCFG